LDKEIRMQVEPGRGADAVAHKWRRAARSFGLTLSIASLVGYTGWASAQSGKLGAYEGTVTVSGTEVGTYTQATYKASLKVRLPLVEVSKRAAHAEVGDVDKPSATAVIAQWDTAGRNSSPDSDGKISSWTCKLAAPTEVPMNGSGVLDVDYVARTHTLFVAYVAVKPVPFNCVSSRSGPYKKTELVSLFFGTNEPDVAWKALSFADPARLSARHTLVPVGPMKGRNGPQEQSWDLQLMR
jgi:hypothetical protein